MDTTLDACPSSPRPCSGPAPRNDSNSLRRASRYAPAGFAADWTLWSRQEWGQWPGFERYAGRQDTRARWQDYGYRVEDHSTLIYIYIYRQGNKLRWICADCFARGFKKKSAFSFVCFDRDLDQETLSRVARYVVCPADPKVLRILTVQGPGVAPCRRGEGGSAQPSDHAFHGRADLTNPNDQFLLGKLWRVNTWSYSRTYTWRLA